MLGSLRQALSVFITVRIAATVVALLGLSSIPAQKTIAQQGYVKPVYSKLFELLIGCWETADGIWYLGIAANGYSIDPASYAFMPLYPSLIAALNWILPFPPIVAALLISNLSFLLALAFVHRLVLSESDRATADRTIWYLALFPGALFFFAPYTESLYLCLASASLLSARMGRWLQAAVLGALLGLTRNLGAAILIPLLIEFFRQRRLLIQPGAERPPDRPSLTSLLLILFLVPAGLLGWMIYCGWSSGDPLIFVHQQSQWQRESMAPWMALTQGIQQAWNYSLSYPGGPYVYEAIAVTGTLLLGVWGLIRRKISLPLSAFLWLGLLPALTAPYEGRTLMSCCRFVAVLFPTFFILAQLGRNRSVDQSIRIGFAAAFGLAVALYVCNQNMF